MNLLIKDTIYSFFQRETLSNTFVDIREKEEQQDIQKDNTLLPVRTFENERHAKGQKMSWKEYVESVQRIV